MMRQFLPYLFLLILGVSCSDNTTDKKVFRMNISAGLPTLDPARAGTQPIAWATMPIFNGLVELDDQLKIQPDLAESWEVSEDGKTYTFKLRKGVLFHTTDYFEGRELKASDFVYSFFRIVDSTTASTGQWIFNDVLKNEKGLPSDTAFIAVDDYTFRVYLEKPFPLFLQVLTMPYAYVLPKEVVEEFGKDFRSHPIGTGPFKMLKWDEGSSLILKKNENYWKKDEEGNALPYIDGIQFSFIRDKNQAFRSFKMKELDFFSDPDAESKTVVFDEKGKVRDEFADQFRVEVTPYMNTEYLGFLLDSTVYNDPNHPFMNKKFRQALNYGVNREELILAYRNGIGEIGDQGIVPPVFPEFKSEASNGYTYDNDKALELLAEAGYPHGEGLPVLTLNTSSQHQDIALYLAKIWKDIGVKVKVETHEGSTLIGLVNTAKVPFFRASWVGDYYDPENYLALFYSKNFTPGGINKTHFKSERYDSLYIASKKEMDPAKRAEMYLEMDQIIIDEAPVIVLFYDDVIRLTQKNIKGLMLNAMNNLDLERVRIE